MKSALEGERAWHLVSGYPQAGALGHGQSSGFWATVGAAVRPRGI